MFVLFLNIPPFIGCMAGSMYLRSEVKGHMTSPRALFNVMNSRGCCMGGLQIIKLIKSDGAHQTMFAHLHHFMNFINFICLDSADVMNVLTHSQTSETVTWPNTNPDLTSIQHDQTHGNKADAWENPSRADADTLADRKRFYFLILAHFLFLN